jgi:HK97 family phage prohead protease
MSNIERRDYAATFATPTEETRSLAGHAAVFNSPSNVLFDFERGPFVEVVAPGAFTRTLADGHNVFALWSHDMAQPLGSTTGGKLSLREDETGLAFDLDTARFNPAQLGAAADGELRMSFGFSVREDDWSVGADGRPVRTLIDVDLFEVSPVINPAYEGSTAALRSYEKWEESKANAPNNIRLKCELNLRLQTRLK